MKKVIYAIALVSLFSLASNAQEPKKDPKKQTPVTHENDTKTIKTEEAPKKGGTRMAINEKGLPGTKTKSQNSKETPKENTKTQPGANKE